MIIDKYGQQILTEDDLCNYYLTDPTRKIKFCITDKPIILSDECEIDNKPNCTPYDKINLAIEDWDKVKQQLYFIPEAYKIFDIAKYVLDKCKSEEELQRAGQELLLYQERDLFPLLVYLKYLVDVMREQNIVWGVGRGSSVASFVLYLLEIHRINSLYYDLSIDEFLKP